MPAPHDLAHGEPTSGGADASGAVHIDSLLLVDFTALGNGASFRTSGWSAPEARLTWTLGPRSGLRLPAPWDGRPLVLELDVNPCRHPPHVTGQILSITVNGHFFGRRLLTQRTVLHCPLTPDIWQGRDGIEVAFEHPNFFVPRLLRQSGDGRPLAVSFFSVRLYSPHAPMPTIRLPVLPAAVVAPLRLAELPPPGPTPPAPAEARAETYGFGVRKPGTGFAREGWAAPEPDFQWTDGPFARLEIPAPAAAGPHLLRLTCSAFIQPPRVPAQDLSITLAGSMLAQLTVKQKATFSLPLPTEDVPFAALLDLGLHLPGAARPAELGASSDARQLGICVHAIVLEPLAPALTGWAGRRVDEGATPATAPRVADRFCAVSDEALPATVAADLGRTPAEVLRAFATLTDADAPRQAFGLRIFVLKPARKPALAEILTTLQEVNRPGRNMLLYVVSGAPAGRSGAVELLGPGLLCGHLAAAAMTEEGADWLRLCANAFTLLAPDEVESIIAPAATEAVAPPAPPVPKVAPPIIRGAERFCGLQGDALRAKVTAELGLTPADLLRDFESLGDTCEFGIAQRKLDIEGLGLFRFANAPLDGLLRGFADEFAALADPSEVTIDKSAGDRPEFILSVLAYELRWHTFVLADQADAETTRRQQATKLGFMRRKFLESLRASRKIFVLRRDRELAPDEVEPLLQAISRYGRNTLLFVVPGAASERNGAVELLGPGLLRGHIGAFAPDEGVKTAASADDWLRLCANAWTLRALGKVPAKPPASAEPAAPAQPPPPDPTLPSAAVMLRACESLGETGEFGLVQRKAGLDVLGLFRFADTPLPGLLAAFADDFAAIGDPGATTIAVNDAAAADYTVAVDRYGIRWATHVRASEADAATTLQRQGMKLGYLRRKFLEALRAGGRVFVLRRDAAFSDAEVARVAEALARHGRHTLLVVAADPAAAGEVVQVAPGLLRGRLPRLAQPADPGAADVAGWLRLIGNAWRLHEAHVASQG